MEPTKTKTVRSPEVLVRHIDVGELVRADTLGGAGAIWQVASRAVTPDDEPHVEFVLAAVDPHDIDLHRVIVPLPVELPVGE